MRAPCLLALLALLLYALPAQAQQLTLSTQLDYLLVDQGFRDPDQRVTTSGFRPKVNLSLTGQVRPGSRLYLDLTGGLTQDTFGLSRQSTDDMHLVLRHETPRYRLSLRHGQSHFSSSLEGLDLNAASLSTNSQESDVTLLLREPSWPTLNLQYGRYASEAGFGGSATHTQSEDRRVSAGYDLAPLHLRFDDTHRTGASLGSAGFALNTRRLGVSLDTALFPRLSLYGDLQLSHTDLRTGDASPTGSDVRLGSLHLSTELTPKAAVDAQLFSQQISQFGGPGGLAVHGSSLSLRSEVVPDLQLNLARSALHSDLAGQGTDSTTITADLLARFDPRNSFALSVSPSHATFSNGPGVDQRAYRLSWSSQLNAQADLMLSSDRFLDTAADFRSRSTSTYLALRYHPDLQTTLGLGLLSDRASTAGAGEPTSRQASALDAELSWLPASDLSLGFHLGLNRLRGATDTRVTVPAFDIRWQPDAKSDLSLSFRTQRQVDRELDLTSRLGFSAVSGHFSRRLSRASDITVTYDVLTFTDGPFAYERRLGLSLTTGLGR